MCSNQHVIKASCYDKKGRLVGHAWNSYKKTHPIQAYFAEKVGEPHKKYLHAEIAALLKCGRKKVYSIHIERYNKAGMPLLAKPCPICSEAIKAWGVEQITYTLGTNQNEQAN